MAKPTKHKPTRAHASGKAERKRSVRVVEHVRSFVGASPEVRQAAYLKRAQTVGAFAQQAINVFLQVEPEDPLWESMAKKIDDAFNALRPRGEIPAARMQLLQCVDDAVGYRERAAAHADELAALERVMVAPDDDDVSPEDRAKARTAQLAVPGALDVRAIKSSGRDVAELETWALAAFMFPLRCMQFASALRPPEALRALATAVDAWSRAPGRPRSEMTGPTKWEAANALMQSVDLVGTTEASLEAEWRAWRRDRSGSKAK